MSTIRSMPLYATIDRVHREVSAFGDGPLAAEQLYPFDQFHYLGTQAVQHAAGVLAPGPHSRVVEIGSGIGGPARYLAAATGCHVTAVELQPELHAIAASLTERCGLASRVTHVLGDARTALPETPAFDAAVSWLAIHHIPDRPRLLRRVAASLVSGGRLYIEDLYTRAPFSAADADAVAHALYGVTMSSVGDYEADLRGAGFDELVIDDMTDSWGEFCAGRAGAWRAARERHVHVHGEAVFATLDEFFTTVQRLFASGSLGGVRITGRRARRP